MINTPTVLWHEWFNDKRKNDFTRDTQSIWDLLLRNGIATTVFKKWLREQVCNEAEVDEITEKKKNEIINKWLTVRRIDENKFIKDRDEILKNYKITGNNFDIYCENELKAIQWAKDKWNESTPQLF